MLDSGFQSPGFRIPEAKNSWIPESGFPYMGREENPFSELSAMVRTTILVVVLNIRPGICFIVWLLEKYLISLLGLKKPLKFTTLSMPDIIVLLD